MELPNFPRFSPQTRIYFRGSKDYVPHAYQYATSSRQANEDAMMPAAVIYPKSVEDIIAAVNYVRENDMGLAVRTGGHHYCGASSTSGENIQLDISDTFQSVYRDFRYNPKTNLLRTGISFSLLEFTSLLRNMQMFLPHGLCSNVHLGGHVQTGGYGMLMRSFGLMSDYIEAFEIVLANGKHERIWKPNSPFALDGTTEENNDLFWAVMGGSPGNFGVLTHVIFRPLHDKDYPGKLMLRTEK